MPRHVALLRGINVGGRHKLPMKALVALFEQAGCSNVRTYIQSGNVVFDAAAAVARTIAASLSSAIEDDFGFSVPVIIRTATDMERVARANPFLGRGAKVEQLHVAFLASNPRASVIATLDPARSPPDAFHVAGSEIYLRCPNGMGRTKFNNVYFDTKLGIVSTIRNWNTVTTLAEMAR